MSDLYTRPVPTDDDLDGVARLMMALSDAPRRVQLAVISAVLVENVSLTREVNEHRLARGYDPLPTYEPKLEV